MNIGELEGIKDKKDADQLAATITANGRPSKVIQGKNGWKIVETNVNSTPYEHVQSGLRSGTIRDSYQAEPNTRANIQRNIGQDTRAVVQNLPRKQSQSTSQARQKPTMKSQVETDLKAKATRNVKAAKVRTARINQQIETSPQKVTTWNQYQQLEQQKAIVANQGQPTTAQKLNTAVKVGALRGAETGEKIVTTGITSGVAIGKAAIAEIQPTRQLIPQVMLKKEVEDNIPSAPPGQPTVFGRHGYRTYKIGQQVGQPAAIAEDEGSVIGEHAPRIMAKNAGTMDFSGGMKSGQHTMDFTGGLD